MTHTYILHHFTILYLQQLSGIPQYSYDQHEQRIKSIGMGKLQDQDKKNEGHFKDCNPFLGHMFATFLIKKKLGIPLVLVDDLYPYRSCDYPLVD